MDFLKQNKAVLFSALILFGLGIFLGGILSERANKNKVNSVAAQAKPLRQGGADYKYINPLLGYDTAKATEFGEYEELQGRLEKKANDEIYDNTVTKFSVYFRDLSRGRWLGVNEDTQYSPASLLKVPIMMVYYKLSEAQPALLSQQIKFDGSSIINTIETIKASQHIQAGQSYTIDQLINAMIIYSDNDALELLYKNIDQQSLNKFFSDFGILLPDVKGSGAQDFISPKTYALFFRVLYGATYLSRFDSEKALELLQKVEYKNALVAGVPENIDVLHKFGEYGTTEGNQVIREFHDCGIIFYPNHPYLLCVMTKGGDIGKLQSIVKETSEIVYDEIQRIYH